MSPTAADLAAKRAALAERWVGHGLSPMSEFEMAGAVYRDSLVVGWSTLTIDAYDRRGLLNLVAELLDRLAEGVAASGRHGWHDGSRSACPDRSDTPSSRARAVPVLQRPPLYGVSWARHGRPVLPGEPRPTALRAVKVLSLRQFVRSIAELELPVDVVKRGPDGLERLGTWVPAGVAPKPEWDTEIRVPAIPSGLTSDTGPTPSPTPAFRPAPKPGQKAERSGGKP